MRLGMELDRIWAGKQSQTPHKLQNRRNQGCKWRLASQSVNLRTRRFENLDFESPESILEYLEAKKHQL